MVLSKRVFGTGIRFAAGAAAAVLGAVLACGILVPQQACAVTAAEVEAEAQDVLVQLNAMQDTLDEASQTYFERLSEYQNAVEMRDAARARINDLQAEIADLQTRLGNRARDMYRNGQTPVIELLLGSTSWDEFATNWDMLNKLNEQDAAMSARTRALKEEQEKQEAEYSRLADIAEKKSAEAYEAFEQASKLVEEMQEKYDTLSAEAQELYAQEQAAAAAAAAAQAGYGGLLNDDGTVTDIYTGQVYSSAYEYSAATGNAVVDRALAQLGADYVWGGTGGDWGGFDCSGFVSYALTGETGVRLGTTETFMGWNQVYDPQPGDVCVIHEPGGNQHTGIYIGDGQMVHAASSSEGVIVSGVQDGMIYVRP